MCTIITAAACATISTAPPERGELLPTEVRLEENPEDANLLKQVTIEVQRYRDMDRLISSYHNIVTLSTLEVSQFVSYFEFGVTLKTIPFSSICCLQQPISYQIKSMKFFHLLGKCIL